MSDWFPSLVFVGKAGSGKTTLAELLVQEFLYTRLSFAAPLKVMCATQTDRAYLQRMGANVRDLIPLAWVRLLLHERDKLAPLDRARTVVDDCRYSNELVTLMGEGFVPVRIEASTATRLDRLRRNGKLGTYEEMEHESETQLDGVPLRHTISNELDTTREELWSQLTAIMNKERH